MTDPVLVDPAGVRALADRMRSVAEEIAATSIPAPALAGSALARLEAPRFVTAEARRLGAAVAGWAQTAQRCADDLNAAETVSGDRLRAR